MVERKARVLAVDDDQPTREMLERSLFLRGFDCTVAGSAVEAAELLAVKDFDVLLLDILMPGRSGMELLRVVADHPHMAVVVLSAFADAFAATKALKVGADDYVTKPVNLDELAVRLERAIERRTTLARNEQMQEAIGEFAELLEERRTESAPRP